MLHRPPPGGLADRGAPSRIGQERHHLGREGLRITAVDDHRCGRCAVGEIDDVADRGAQRRDATRSRLDHGDRGGIMDRCQHVHLGALQSDRHEARGELTAELDGVGTQPERHRPPLYCAVERVEPDEFERGDRDGATDVDERFEQQERVLDPVEIGDAHQPTRDRRPRARRSEPRTVDPERHDGVDPFSVRPDVVGHPATADGDHVRAPVRSTGDQPSAEPAPSAVAVLGQGDQLTAGAADHDRHPEPFAAGDRDHPADAGPHTVDHIGPVLCAHCRDGPADEIGERQRRPRLAGRPGHAHVQHLGSEQFVPRIGRLLTEGEHRHPVSCGQPFDQLEENRDDPFGARSVDATGDDEEHVHGLYGTPMDRGDQDTVLCWVLDAIDGRIDAPPALPADRLRRALLVTGLGALVGVLGEHNEIAFDADIGAHLDEQRDAVATRQQRYLALAPEVFQTLDVAGVAATPVKGIVLTSVGVWPWRSARPMADIDVLVPDEQRARAVAALQRSGLTLAEQSDREDVFIAWGDGGVGRTDGESADHNGKVELHPGWSEQLHGYDAVHHDLLRHAERRSFLGVTVSQLPPAWLVAHVIGHLSACVVRREVRAVNIVDAVLALRWIERADQPALIAALRSLDPRLAEPGIWLVDQYAASDLDRIGLLPDLRRLSPEAAGWLRRTPPHDVLRDAVERTPWSWRAAFTHGTTERASAMREALLPPSAQLRRGDPDASLLTLYARRLRRATSRARRRATPS